MVHRCPGRRCEEFIRRATQEIGRSVFGQRRCSHFVQSSARLVASIEADHPSGLILEVVLCSESGTLLAHVRSYSNALVEVYCGTVAELFEETTSTRPNGTECRF